MTKIQVPSTIEPQARDTTAIPEASEPRPPVKSQEGDQPSWSMSDVSLSESAQQISSLEKKLKALPGINLDRIEAIREDIIGGAYIVDAEKIVSTLLSLERSFVSQGRNS